MELLTLIRFRCKNGIKKMSALEIREKASKTQKFIPSLAPTLWNEHATLLKDGVEEGKAKEGLGLGRGSLANKGRRPALVRAQEVALDSRRGLQRHLNEKRIQKRFVKLE